MAKKYNSDAARDPIWYFMLLKILSKGWREWNDIIVNHLDDVKRPPMDREDESAFEAQSDAYNRFILNHNKEHIEKAEKEAEKKKKKEKKLEDRSRQKEKKTNIKQNKEAIKAEIKKEKEKFRHTKEGQKRAKRRTSVIVSLVMILLIAVGSLIAIYELSPQVLFGKNIVEYYLDGERVTVSAVYTKYYEIEIPQKLGYTFKGLYDSENENSNQAVGENGRSIEKWSKMTKEQLVTLYPKWEPITYTFICDANGGNEIGRQTFDVVYDTHMPSSIFCDITRTGYTFLGWSTDDDAMECDIADANGNVLLDKDILNASAYTDLSEDSTAINLYAVWQNNRYTVKYQAESDAQMEASEAVVTYDNISELEVPKKHGFVFAGWYFANTDIQATDGSGMLISPWQIAENDTDLVAKWNLAEYRITFANCNDMEPLTVEYTKTANLPIPTRYKYDTFISWSYEYDVYTSDDIFTMPAQDVVMTANWDTNGWVLIGTAEDFKNIGKNLSGKFLLTDDIDLGGAWTPIGDRDWSFPTNSSSYLTSYFSGILDGANHKIKYRTIMNGVYKDTCYAWGLFATAKNATFLDIVIDASISTPYDLACTEMMVGGLVGFAVDSTFRNISTTASTNIQNVDTDQASGWIVAYNGYTIAGGIIGNAIGCGIYNCTNRGTVFAKGFHARAGGVVGRYTKSDCILDGNSGSGNVSADHGGWIGGDHVSATVGIYV